MRGIDQGSPWTKVVHQLGERQESYVLLTLLGVEGSTPRDSGTKMVVTANTTFGTIGGGHLEHETTRHARALLAERAPRQQLEHFALGPNLGQCCGGRTTVLFEVFFAEALHLQLFGAGHVGKALVRVLAGLPARVRWVDNRPELFPDLLPDNVIRVDSDHPVDEVADMPAGAWYLVLTHNHQLDFELCETILRRGDFHYLGLIGSRTKWARFRKQLLARGFDAAQVDSIASPVGLPEVPGKQPMEVAVSIAGQLIQRYQRDRVPATGPSKRDFGTLLSEQGQSY